MERERVRLDHMLVLLAVLTAAGALTLRAVDGIARSAAEPDGGRSYGSVAEVERALRTRLSLPGYFPAAFRWPPQRIAATTRGAGAVVLSFAGKQPGIEMLLGQTVEGEGAFPPALWPAAVVLETAPIEDCGGARRGTIGRIHAKDGSLWHEVSCPVHGRRVALRSNGSTEELLKMADSLEREGPHP